jgi:hypothetical protein
MQNAQTDTLKLHGNHRAARVSEEPTGFARKTAVRSRTDADVPAIHVNKHDNFWQTDE